MRDAALEVDAEAGHVVTALDRLDTVLATRSLYDRIASRYAAVEAAPSRRRKVAR